MAQPIVERVEFDGELLAMIVRAAPQAERTQFYTPRESPLQIGHVVRRSGDVIRPHRHPDAPRLVSETHEVLVVERGRMRVMLHSDDGVERYRGELATGDRILLAAGAHGFEVLEDTVLFEVKQGPYPGDDNAKKFLR